MASVSAKTYKTQVALAKRLGFSQPRLNKLMGDGDWLVNGFGRGPWSERDAERIESWLESRRSGNTPLDPVEAIKSMGPERQWKLKLLAVRVAKLEAEQKLMLKQYIPREDVERERVQRVLAVKSELMNTARLMSMLEGCATPGEMEMQVQDWARGICERFAGSPN